MQNQIKYLARYSNHINEDLQRGWSSWNYGQDGLNCTEEELQDAINQVLNGELDCIYCSGFDLYADDLKTTEFGELYENYWVVKDKHFSSSLAAIVLHSTDLTSAIEEASNAIYSGDGVRITEEYKLVHSINNEIHIFELMEE